MNSILTRLEVLENKVNNKGRAYFLGDSGPNAISTTSITFVPFGTQKTFTSYGGDFLVDITMTIYKSSSGWSWENGVRIDGVDYNMSWGCNMTTQTVSASRRITGIAAGDHTIQIVYRSNSNTSATIIPAYMSYSFNLAEL